MAGDSICGDDVPAVLSAVAMAYQELESENKALKTELRGMTLRNDGQSCLCSVDQVASYAGPVSSLTISYPPRASDMGADGSRWRLLSSSRANTGHLIGEKRNAERARLQSLINDLDPEERGEWATEELTIGGLMDTAWNHSKYESDIAVVSEILDALRDHFAPAAATKLKFINLTNFEQIEGIFGRQRVEDVMRLQDAVAWDIKNCLLKDDEASPPFVLRNTSMPKSVWKLAKGANSMRRQPLRLVETVGFALVIINTVMLGVSTDVHPEWPGWDWLSAGLAFAFLVEMSLRVALGGGFRQFFLGPQRAWNAFEAVIVIIAVLDVATIMVQVHDLQDAKIIALCRMVRLVRLTRIARLARTGIFHELSYMLRGIEAGKSTLIWAFVLLILVCYAGGIFLTLTIGRDAEFSEPDISVEHFSSIGNSMFTLFRCFTGDCSSSDGLPLVYPLQRNYGILVAMLYGMALMLVSFGLFNVMIASFVQSTMRATKYNDVERRRALKRERKMVRQKTTLLINRIKELYLSWTSRRSEPNNGTHSVADLRITREMFATFLEDAEIQRWFENMGCEDSVRGKLFDKIDRDGNGVLECSELVTGVVDILRDRFDNLDTLTGLVQSIHHRLMQMEAGLLMRYQQSQREVCKSRSEEGFREI